MVQRWDQTLSSLELHHSRGTLKFLRSSWKTTGVTRVICFWNVSRGFLRIKSDSHVFLFLWLKSLEVQGPRFEFFRINTVWVYLYIKYILNTHRHWRTTSSVLVQGSGFDYANRMHVCWTQQWLHFTASFMTAFLSVANLSFQHRKQFICFFSS